MIYANSSYYIVDFDGVIIPKKKANKYCNLATHCINLTVPRLQLENCDSEQLKRCCCRIAEILYGYCKENGEEVVANYATASKLFENEQIKIQIRNTIILYLKINILQKAE